MRTIAIRRFAVYIILAGLGAFGVCGAASMFYVAFHDHLVVALMARQSQMQYAYEDKLDALRSQLRLETSRQLADQATVERSVGALLSREARLETRAAQVAGLAVQALDRPGVETAAAGPMPTKHSTAAPNPLLQMQPSAPDLPDGMMSFAPDPGPTLPPVQAKPHPEAFLSAPDAVVTSSAQSRAAQLDMPRAPVKTRLALLSASLDRIEQGQVGAVFELGSAARAETNRLRGVIEEAGLSPDRFKAGSGRATGGPYVPLPGDETSSFAEAIETFQSTIQSVGRLRGAIGHVPLAAPLPGSPEVTSPFGTRLDPFLGRPALHTGVDLKQDTGAEVRVTATGRVSFAGAMGGYGNLVEVDHGNGLTSRYAHLSQILVSEGEAVTRGQVVGAVGSTGRATGPHLHYEVRIDGEAVDPVRFLNAGAKLASVEKHL